MSSAAYWCACSLIVSALFMGAPPSAAHPSHQDASLSDGQREAMSREIDRLIGSAISSNAMPGASVSIIFADGSTLSRAYGVASIEEAAPVLSATRFRIGSISKLVTALAVLRLVEEHRLDLDAPVSSILADWPEVARLPASISVRHLLNHTSGLPDFTRAELEAKVAQGFTTDRDVSMVLQRPVRSEPGAEWAYADLPFRILSRVVERASGQPYGDYISRTLAPALNLPSLRLCEPGEADHAIGYISRKATLQQEAAYSIRGLLGEGGLCATSQDLARLPHEIVRLRWINQRSLAAMLTPTRLNAGQLIDYGLGVRGGWLGTDRLWGHTGGGLDGSWAALGYFPDRRISIAVVANGTGSEIDAATLLGAIANAVRARPRLDSQPVKDSFARLISGAYRRGDTTTCIEQTSTGVTRVRRGSASAPTPLLHEGSGRFARSDFPLDRIVFQIEGKTAVGYSVYYDGLFAEYWNRVPHDPCAAR